MTIDIDSLRPHGVRRKILQSPAITLSTAGDFIIGYLPHGAKILGMWAVTTTALTTAASVIDIGVAQNGDTIIDGKSLTHTASAIGDVTDIWQTKGTNGGLVDIPTGILLWLQTDGGSDAGAVIVVTEYEDRNN